jgi:hypothetical protein
VRTLARIVLQYMLIQCATLSVCASLCQPATAADIPSVGDAELEAALVLAGDNRGELERALDYGIQKPHAMQAMRFVVGNLPLSDLGRITSAELIENYELALQASGEAPYTSDPYSRVIRPAYDGAIWAHYVLPPRVSQEPLSPWRRYLRAELAPVVAGATTLEEAAVLVNAWCGKNARFEQTQSRDQGPLATLKSGYGRCEELCILYIDACRAVGIPARMAYSPWWAVSDNNHAWCEVYGSDGRWHYTGGCEPAPTLDDAWFGQSVKSAALIVSPTFGLPEELPSGGAYPDGRPSDLLDWQAAAGARYSRVNSTSFYRQTGVLRVRFEAFESDFASTGLLGRAEALLAPINGVPHSYTMSIHVFNYGALRSIAKVKLDPEGRGAIELGVGTYVVTSDVPGAPPEAVFRVTAGQDQELLWDDHALKGDSVVLEFPAD